MVILSQLLATDLYNLTHAKNLVVNDPAALITGRPSLSASKEELIETIRVLQLYLGKTIEVAEYYALKEQNV